MRSYAEALKDTDAMFPWLQPLTPHGSVLQHPTKGDVTVDVAAQAYHFAPSGQVGFIRLRTLFDMVIDVRLSRWLEERGCKYVSF